VCTCKDRDVSSSPSSLLSKLLCVALNLKVSKWRAGDEFLHVAVETALLLPLNKIFWPMMIQ